MSALQLYQDNDAEYQHLLEEMELLKDLDKSRLEKAFIPDNPDAKPFYQQLIFFQTEKKTQLLRCGNRAAKTFTWVRDRAWKLMRNHPYKKRWNHDYNDSEPKLFWMVGPTFQFCTEVVWAYLKSMIPEWYYTDESGNLMIDFVEKDQIEKVRFRNGDVVEFKTYSQSLLTKMGRAIDDLSVDEMPPHLKIVTELMVRVLDKSGEVTYAFTPVNPNPEIQKYLDNHPSLELHSWSVTDNPVFYDPEKRQRLFDEYKGLSKEERDTRLNGDWFVVVETGNTLMQGSMPKLIDDFPFPPTWRRARVVDPAAIRTGVAWFVEDPTPDPITKLNTWYCYAAKEIQWGEAAASADLLKKEINKDRPYLGFKYCMSIYDNHELWFVANGDREDWRPCIGKNREQALVNARDTINTHRVVFFRRGAMMLLQQMALVKATQKYKDHMLDCFMYFCREIPFAVKTTNFSLDEKQELLARYMATKEAKQEEHQKMLDRPLGRVRFRPHVQKLCRRSLR
jgi:hypothetical protein